LQIIKHDLSSKRKLTVTQRSQDTNLTRLARRRLKSEVRAASSFKKTAAC